MRHLMTLIFTAVLFSACSKDDKTDETPLGKVFIIETEEGAFLEVTTSGKTEKISGSSVIPGNGQLMNQSFFRQFGISTTSGTLYLRFNFPSSMIGKVDENMFKEHGLTEYRLSLQESGSITGVAAEAYFPSSQIFVDENSTGKVLLRKNHEVNKIIYSVFGEAEINVKGKDGQLYFIKGYFWKK